MPGKKPFEAEYRINKLNPNIHDTEWEMNPETTLVKARDGTTLALFKWGDILATLIQVNAPVRSLY